MFHIVHVTVPTPPMGRRLLDGELPGVFFGVTAPGQRPAYVAVAEIVALQGQADVRDIAGAGGPRKPQVVCDYACPEVNGFFRVNRRAHRQAHTLGTLHNITAHQLHAAAGFLHHHSFYQIHIFRDSVLCGINADNRVEGFHLRADRGIAATARRAPERRQSTAQEDNCQQDEKSSAANQPNDSTHQRASYLNSDSGSFLCDSSRSLYGAACLLY